ncbi:MAG: hypothetical protein LBM62_06055 [Mediterranea sp.]|jgi:hypothetical protein|nr:hypothetical protein [Mediterranea sp.]
MKRNNINVGKVVKQTLAEQGRSVSWLATKVHYSVPNMYHILGKESVEVDLLWQISELLGVDFFAYFSEELSFNMNVPHDK